MRPLQQLRAHGGDIWGLGAGGSGDLLDFSANINPLGLSAKAQKAMIEAIPQLVHYPDPQCRQLRQRLSELLGLSLDQIMIGNGAVELIFLVVKELQPRRLLLPAPTFCEYALAAAAESVPVHHLLPSGRAPYYDLGALVAAIQPGDLIFLCNPNNPTGQLLPRSDLQYLVEQAAARSSTVVVDEAFIDFVDHGETHSVLPLLSHWSNLMVLRSLTKFYALPGIRIGYLLGPAERLARLQGLRDPWSVNHLAQVAALASMDDQAYAERTCQWLRDERSWFLDALEQIPGLHPYLPTANYLLVDCCESGHSASVWAERLRRERILIRDCSTYLGLDSYWFRVAVRDRQSNRCLLEALRRAAHA